MFGEPTVKNRRFNPYEREQEIQEAKIWDRYPRDFIFDRPHYKNLIPEPIVNFRLNYVD